MTVRYQEIMKKTKFVNYSVDHPLGSYHDHDCQGFALLSHNLINTWTLRGRYIQKQEESRNEYIPNGMVWVYGSNDVMYDASSCANSQLIENALC